MKIQRASTWRWFINGVAVSLLLVVLGFCGGAWQVYDYSQRHDDQNADAALVLGAAAWGGRPSPVFRERINHALSLYQARRVRMLVFTGGTPEPGYPTEAAVGRRYAIERGVPPEDILIETESRTTYDNLRNAGREAHAIGLDSFLIVSDPYHMRRAMLMAHDLGLKAYPAPTPSSRYQTVGSQLHFLFKETQNYLAYRLFRKLS
ncbi:YdcF family protein [Crenobacter sp. SG2303]|uniref:YdcF family protein n=1 Tax=Crenobacter oryzisoli TaxID=3056844 RepID=A0ABT7XQ66_9NEIS|nr:MULTISPECIES: YdcF family protein [unclassified Crenobacter]MDN0075934.1 YdcF family protein [Crenobacter sp. SG2303]MDN0085124.1 YdcF family protein [Crenobacter sp. SG2305]